MAIRDILQAAAGASGPATYIEDVFSTYLYTGNGSTQTITNGIDLSGKGGLVWNKKRSAVDDHYLWDTVRPIGSYLSSNLTDAQGPTSTGRIAYSSTGFSWQAGGAGYNQNGATYASWTFRKQPKFFDVVTYTGNGSNRTIAHNLGSVPGCIMVKRTDTTGDWQVYHRSLANTEYMVLNTTAAKATGATRWNSTTPTSTVFSVGTDATVNANGGTYVAYLFAHDAGGFGLTGTDNVISCGSYLPTGGVTSVTLGYEPQWLLIKSRQDTSQWVMCDNMRGVSGTSSTQILFANTANSEFNGAGADRAIEFTSTGFKLIGTDRDINNSTYSGSLGYIYIAIRRGPMKTPTTGTEVFTPTYGDNNGIAPGFISNFPVDLAIFAKSSTGTTLNRWTSRLTSTYFLESPTTAAEALVLSYTFDFQNGCLNATTNLTSAFSWLFKRAPGFFDVVCYTGNDANRTLNHNLGVAPELIIIKSRNATAEWITSVPGGGWGNTQYLIMNNTFAVNNYGALNVWNATAPTSTVFSLGTITSVNWSSANYIAYLFASCPGVSKVGNYTGNGSSQTINCGFTGGARFVLIKRTDSAGSWLVWDSARGIVAGNDPYLALNSTAAEVTTDDSIDTDNSGFVVNQVTATNINVSSATYIYLAIA